MSTHKVSSSYRKLRIWFLVVSTCMKIYWFQKSQQETKTKMLSSFRSVSKRKQKKVKEEYHVFLTILLVWNAFESLIYEKFHLNKVLGIVLRHVSLLLVLKEIENAGKIFTCVFNCLNWSHDASISCWLCSWNGMLSWMNSWRQRNILRIP